jgi:two-component system sensor histidine kinase CpxA
MLLIHATSLLGSDLFVDIRLWGMVVFTVLAISALCWLPFLRGLTRDIAGLQLATRQIAGGDFRAAVPAGRGDEIGEMSRHIGRMGGQLERFVHSQKRFLGDIAHELCAPLARIQFAVGILEQRTGEGAQPQVDRLRQELEEMTELVNELLQFSKADVQSPILDRGPVEVAGAIERAAAREGLVGGKLQASVEPGLMVLAREPYLVRAFANVLRNAARYAAGAGPIEVAASATGEHVVVEITDHGPGLPEVEVENIFEPFYRPQNDQNRQVGGAGLGLAIVKSCVEACGGTVECSANQPHGLIIRMRFQRARDKAGGVTDGQLAPSHIIEPNGS